MESVKISPKKCKIAMALAGHHRAVHKTVLLLTLTKLLMYRLSWQ